MLKFTPLEFETHIDDNPIALLILLKFTPLEFETPLSPANVNSNLLVKIYSVGV